MIDTVAGMTKDSDFVRQALASLRGTGLSEDDLDPGNWQQVSFTTSTVTGGQISEAESPGGLPDGLSETLAHISDDAVRDAQTQARAWQQSLQEDLVAMVQQNKERIKQGCPQCGGRQLSVEQHSSAPGGAGPAPGGFGIRCSACGYSSAL